MRNLARLNVLKVENLEVAIRIETDVGNNEPTYEYRLSRAPTATLPELKVAEFSLSYRDSVHQSPYE